MSIQNLFQENDYSIYAKSLFIEDLETEQLTIVNSVDNNIKVDMTVNSANALVLGDSGNANVFCNSIQFSNSNSSILNYYQDPPRFNVVFTDNLGNTYNAEANITRIGNICNLTMRPELDQFLIPNAITNMNSNAFIPSNLMPHLNTYFTAATLVSGAGEILFGVITSGGQVQFTAINGNATIPAGTYVTANFAATYRCEVA